MTGAGLSDPVAARLAVSLGGGLLEDLLDVRPGGGGSTGHLKRREVSAEHAPRRDWSAKRTHAGAVAGALLASRDSRSDEQETLLLELGRAPVRVGEVRVSAVNDDVALLEERLELGDEAVDGVSRLDEQDDLPGRLELRAELLDRVGADDGLACDRSAAVSSEIPTVPGRRGAAGRAIKESAPLASFSRKWSTLEVVRL